MKMKLSTKSHSQPQTKQPVDSKKALMQNGEQEKLSHTLNGIFEQELKDIYSAEKQLLEALPKMADAAYNEELIDAFKIHLQQTERHVERLEKIFDRLNMEVGEEARSKSMEGLIEAGKTIIEQYEECSARDSALIIVVQKIEHYEIASYGSLCELADVLGYLKVAEILYRTLQEEEETDKALTDIAQDVNDDAFEQEEDVVFKGYKY